MYEVRQSSLLRYLLDHTSRRRVSVLLVQIVLQPISAAYHRVEASFFVKVGLSLDQLMTPITLHSDFQPQYRTFTHELIAAERPIKLSIR